MVANMTTCRIVVIFLLLLGATTAHFNPFANLIVDLGYSLSRLIEDYSSTLAQVVNRTATKIDSAIRCNPNDTMPISIPFYMVDENGHLVKLGPKHLKPQSNTTNEENKQLIQKIQFFLYTRETIDNPERLYLNDLERLEETLWDSDRPTVFSTHGFGVSYQHEVCQMIKDAYLSIGDYNVILIDWSEISEKKDFLTAVLMVPYIAKVASYLIDFLLNQNMNPNTTTVVGHSLGAHVAGLAGYYCAAQLYYIVGLDPAGPLFEFRPPSETLSPLSGQYVDVIHTNAGQWGILKNIGKVNFYVNGGRKQPDCRFDPVSSCSHKRAYQIFAHAIRNPSYAIAIKCFSYSCFRSRNCANETTIIGRSDLNDDLYGRYYMMTTKEEPYIVGLCGITPKLSKKCVKSLPYRNYR